MPGNLTNGPDSATQDFATSAWRIRQLGFNAVRLPFRFRDLAKGEAVGVEVLTSFEGMTLPIGTAA